MKKSLYTRYDDGDTASNAPSLNLEGAKAELPHSLNAKPHHSGTKNKRPERRCIASSEILSANNRLRFVASPEGVLVFDIKEKLPGRGAWIRASKEDMTIALKRKAFSRALKTNLKGETPELVSFVTSQLAMQGLAILGLAKSGGQLVTGFDKTHATINSGKAAWLIQARDGARDGKQKLTKLTARFSEETGQIIKSMEGFDASQLSAHLGAPNVIHACLQRGHYAKRFSIWSEKYKGFETNESA